MRAMFGAAVGIAMLCGAAQAQTYPAQPVHILVGFAAGGGTDILARFLGQAMQTQRRSTIIVDNREGAGGNVAAAETAKAAPDGYTVLLSTNGQAISPSLYKRLPYDSDRDLAPVTQLVASANVLLVNNALPAHSFQEFVALAKAKPGALTYASSGVGAALHLTMELIKKQTGIDVVMAPYRGDAPMLQALIAGEVQAAIVPATAAKPRVDSGEVRALAVSSAERLPTLPDVPTFSEQGLPGFSASNWSGLFAPAKTPKPIVDALWRWSRDALAAPAAAAQLATLSLTPVGSSSEDFTKLYVAERARFAQIIKDAGIPQQD